jgi:hypothetical protein
MTIPEQRQVVAGHQVEGRGPAPDQIDQPLQCFT